MRAVILDGIVLGLAFGLLGVGMTLVYGLGGVLNLAYGQIVVLAAIVISLVMEDGVATVWAAFVGVLAAAGAAVVLDLTLMRPVYRQHGEERTLMGLLLTLGAAFVIGGLLAWRYPLGALYINVSGAPVSVSGVPMPVGSIWASVIALAVAGALLLFLGLTTFGRGVRSVIQDETGARLVGINPSRVRTVVFALSGALAGIVAITHSMSSPLTVNAGFEFTTFALIVTVVGGLGSVAGAFLAGVLLGIVNSLSAHYIGQYITTIILPRRRCLDDPHSAPRAARTVGEWRRRETCRVPVRPWRRAAWALIPVAGTAAILAILPSVWFGDSPYTTSLAVQALVFASWGVGFNLIFGCTNQLFLCVGALAGIGAYGTAILADRTSPPMAAGIRRGRRARRSSAGSRAGGRAPLARRHLHRGRHARVLARSPTCSSANATWTGAETGLIVTGAPASLADDRVGAYYLFAGVLVAFLVVFRVLQLSHVGWAFRALRDDEVAAELAGVDIARYRIYAATVGSAMIGLTGAFYAYSSASSARRRTRSSVSTCACSCSSRSAASARCSVLWSAQPSSRSWTRG